MKNRFTDTGIITTHYKRSNRNQIHTDVDKSTVRASYNTITDLKAETAVTQQAMQKNMKF